MLVTTCDRTKIALRVDRINQMSAASGSGRYNRDPNGVVSREGRRLRSTNRRRRYNDLNKSSRHVIDEAGNKPLVWQRGNRLEQGNIAGNRRAGIGDCFHPDFPFLYLKIVKLWHKVRSSIAGSPARRVMPQSVW